MKMLVLGGGLQGSSCSYDLLQQDDVELVTLADVRADAGAGFLKSDPRLERVALDFSDEAATRRLMAEHDVALSAAPYFFNGTLAKLAIEAGCDYSDLGGNTEILFGQLEMSDAAQEAGCTLIPDVGLAPGMVNVLAAEGIRRLDEIEVVKMYVGGLPQHPVPPLNYQVVYSLRGMLDYYTTPSWVIRDGKPFQVEALSEIEHVEFGELGTLEAFHTAGGSSILPWRFEGRVDQLEYKTLRFPGHAEQMRLIRDLGLLSADPVDVKGARIVPRDLVVAVLRPLLTRAEPDQVVLRVTATGTKDGSRVTHRWDLLDREDEEAGISAMERTTGFTLAVVGLLMGRSVIHATGVMPADEGIPADVYLAEMANRGIDIRYSTE
ncbi:MAG: saccharopine dehydrogenase NADP-binding domain-containing protein [Gemmatimonadota bacterium]|nr:saccharopine dehydrogenase NADP-binding domain-containing protein [Gemmatimonadota bacterium]MDH3427020.1 saccharopine dehydrogenase NADP-binding domain-containing protein [Gemmatimonadota bacterium]